MTSTRLFVPAGVSALLVAAGCSSSPSSTGADGSGGSYFFGFGAQTSTGGDSNPASGGDSSNFGTGASMGTGATSNGNGGALGSGGTTGSGGGTASGGTGAIDGGPDASDPGAGGTSNGGATNGGATNGGTTNGGTSNGGTTNGGTSNGGASNGGASNGGASNGGASNGGTSNGGTSNGGTSNGGASNGGTSNGGTSNGGTANGGTANGGTANGGASNGGASNGGTANGGTSNGGTSNGGTSNGGTSSGGDGNADGGENPTQIDPVGNKNRAPGFIDLSPPMGAPFDDVGTTPTTPPPSGWTWHPVAGSMCRDGSGSGVFIHKGTASKLAIYLEGGGACSNDHFCAFNPHSVETVLSGTGQTDLGTAFGVVAGQQQPGVYTGGVVQGIFDFSKTANPFKDWNMVYIPYCTGDVFFGTNEDSTVPGTVANPGPQQFVGYDDMKLFIGRIVPTFKDKVDQVVLTGASAGGFGTALNFSMVQDAFGDIPVLPIDDSGPPFNDQFMPVCMQKKWRAQWGFAKSLPPDCTECNQVDGGGLIHMADFLLRKHPHATIAMISTMWDEVIRLFYTVGDDTCGEYDTADPYSIVLLNTPPLFSAATYNNGLLDLRTTYVKTNKFATYYMGGVQTGNGAYHQHIFRDEFYTAGGSSNNASLETPAAFVKNFIGGTVENVGP